MQSISIQKVFLEGNNSYILCFWVDLIFFFLNLNASSLIYVKFNKIPIFLLVLSHSRQDIGDSHLEF